MKKLRVRVERSEDGTYWGSTINIPGIIVSEGSSLDELKKNLTQAIEETIEIADEEGIQVYNQLREGFEFEFETELTDLFKKYEFLNKSAVAKRLNINPSLFRSYTSDKREVYISEKRAKEIETGLHQLGEELLAIRL
ncbi:type II toxin-antitoxin system HicB family antitoxin [Myroides sp. LJL116]